MSVEAFSYLIRTSSRNRFGGRLKRLRQPRYLLGLALGVGYIYFFFIRYATHPANPTSMILSRGGHAFAAGALFVMTLTSWLFAGDKMALAFSQAEVAFLFTAPVSRRQLVGYKLFRAQFAIAFNVLIWVLLLRHSGPLPVALRAIGMWLLFTTLNFHRLGAALVRSSLGEHRGHGARRHTMSIIIFAALVASVAASIVLHWPEMRHAVGFRAVMSVLGSAINTAPASIALWPFQAVLQPAFATSTSQWLAGLPAALLVLAIHVFWVMRTDRAFEEAAAAASAERATIIREWRESRGWRRRKPASTAVRVPLPLASSGNPAVAIVWKNFICLRRTLRLVDTFPLWFPGAIAGFGAGMDFGEGGFRWSVAITTAALLIAALTFVFGARIVRNDLRHDMLHIVALKTLPLRGHTIVAAEVLSAAIPIAAMQLGSLAVAGLSALWWKEPPLGAGQTAFLFAAAVPALLAYNTASVTVQNAAPVLFPSWTRLGATVNPGLETLGQNLVSMGLVLLLLALMLVLPAAIGGGVWYLLSDGGSISVFTGVVAGAMVLAAESALAILAFGQAFEKTEPSSVG